MKASAEECGPECISLRTDISEILCKDQCLGMEHYYPFNVLVVSKIDFPKALSIVLPGWR